MLDSKVFPFELHFYYIFLASLYPYVDKVCLLNPTTPCVCGQGRNTYTRGLVESNRAESDNE